MREDYVGYICTRKTFPGIKTLPFACLIITGVLFARESRPCRTVGGFTIHRYPLEFVLLIADTAAAPPPKIVGHAYLQFLYNSQKHSRNVLKTVAHPTGASSVARRHVIVTACFAALRSDLTDSVMENLVVSEAPRCSCEKVCIA